MITASLIGLPLIFALLLLFTKGDGAKRIALVASVIVFGVSLVAYYFIYTNPNHPELSYDGTWIPSLGVDFNVSLDGISMVMVLLTTLLVPLIILSSFRSNYENPHRARESRCRRRKV